MSRVSNEYIVNELQLLTGIITDDISYMVYKVLQGGNYGKDKQKEDQSSIDPIIVKVNNELRVEEFEDWFNKL